MLVVILFIFFNNTTFFLTESARRPFLLAHRGLAQTFPMTGIESDTCTAARIYPPEHPYLENTLPSMQAAFAAGAAVVELDIRPTRDGHFVVFHDWTLDCRTEVSGEPAAYTLDELRQVDIGYGYTADGGQTFPFRGEGIGLMPSLDAVFAAFPDRDLLIHIKSNDPAEGAQLAELLRQLPTAQQRRLAVYGGDAPVAALKAAQPEVRVMSTATLKACLLRYLALGWTGYVPTACTGTQLHLPEKFAPWLWGWPRKFIARMDAVDTRVILVAGDGTWSEGFDMVEDLSRIPHGYTGGIWTNRIDRIGPIYQEETRE